MADRTPSRPSGPLLVAWLGLGAMGRPMAARVLLAGHRLLAYDPGGAGGSQPRPGPDETLAAATWADTPAAAAAGCEVLVVMVASPDQAESALFGVDGAAAVMSPGTTVMVLSTLGPASVTSLAERLPTGVTLVDAPVSGGVARAAAGDLLIMASSCDADAAAFLSCLGEVVVVGADPGQGQAMKMVNQVLCGIHIAAAAEALALAAALGIDPEAAWSTVRRGAAASFMLDDRGARMVRGEHEPVRSSISLFVKDLHLVLDEARAANLPVDVVRAAAALFTAAADDGRSAHDDTELYDFVRSLHGSSPGSG